MNETLSDSGIYHHFTWEVRNFFNLPSETDYFLQSAEFRFAGHFYCLRLYPRGKRSNDDDLVYVGIVLVRLPTCVPEKDVWYEIGYKSSLRGEIFKRRYIEFTRCRCTAVESVGGIGYYVIRSEFEAKRNIYAPRGTLTLYCHIRRKELSVLPLHEEEEQKGGVNQLLSDYKRLMLKGAESDACLVVRGKEFQAHKCVLRARSPVFEAMFGHETAEKESGRVNIDDLKSDHFQDFLEYLYTGRVESFSDDNAFSLYAAADKYDVPALKSKCVEYASRSLSVENFCEVITLALRHHEKDLLELAVEFFKKNVAHIILTVKWQQFMSENSARANELFIKVLVPGKESDSVLLL